MSCPDCGARVAVLFNSLEERRCLECLKKSRLRIIEEQKRRRENEQEISLCRNCYCMTHTLVGNVYGKCKKPKHIIDVIGDENIGGESRRLNG